MSAELAFHPLPRDYLDELSKRARFEIVIVGKDPYPTDPVGIPFCKGDWNAMWAEQTSGAYVLRSLGLNAKLVQEAHAQPRDLFMHLARCGVAFLNLSYHYLSGGVRRGRHRDVLAAAHEVNLPVLQKSRRVVLCGEAKRIKWAGASDEAWLEAVHPDVRCKVSRYPNVRSGWSEYWQADALHSRFTLSSLSLDVLRSREF